MTITTLRNSNQLIERLVSWGVFFTLLIIYWLTTPPTVSYWDCPEYVAAAWKLEVGHPPGNPVWMLAERVITLLAPSGKYAALLVNLSSGLFTALAGMLLTKSLWLGIGWLSETITPRKWFTLSRILGAACGGLAFGLSDSAWYSAVEAEVYAMSIFMTALCVWIMIKWGMSRSYIRSTRYLILLAYLFGLSVGIHQLNLLCIPALAMIWSIKRKMRKWWQVGAVLFLSFVAVGCILVGMMPSSIALAAELELLCVNGLGLPYLSGVVAYLVLLGGALILALSVTWHSRNRGLISLAICPALFLSGLFIVSNHFAVGAAITTLVAIFATRGYSFSPRRLNIAVWMLTMLLMGYASYAVIPLRGDIPSPANSSRPGNPFSFASYLAREQYGSSPLLYGHTPYSKNMFQERFDANGKPVYNKYLLKKTHPVYARKFPDGKICDTGSQLSPSDSAFNQKAMAGNRDGYVIKGYGFKPVLTPELNMWFPRITSRDLSDIRCFGDWAGMTPETMTEVEVSEAVDSSGRYVNRLLPDGSRPKVTSLRPTYLQSLRMFLTYQTGYMYWRYFLWNFLGRQNDYHSTGEVEHGNFITGYDAIDNLMLGAEDKLPDHLGRENKGRNHYVFLPLLFGLLGFSWLFFQGKRGRKINLAVGMLFLMTGLAIVVYLNQGPGEPRERDYSFLGSYWAFAAWIGFGVFALMRCRLFSPPIVALVPIAMVGIMGFENYDDHDRSGRMAASTLSANILNSLPQDAIIFVNGDNLTFPLWYAKEVEGIRPDVRVINVAYLGVPTYVEALTRDWDGARRVEMTLNPASYIYGALQSVSFNSSSKRAPFPARTLLDEMNANPGKQVEASRVWLPLSATDSVEYPLCNLTRSGNGRVIDFAKLATFDIIASNARSSRPRPIFWIRPLPAHNRIGLAANTSESLFAYQLGKSDIDSRERELKRVLPLLRATNAPGDVYMDMIPAGQSASFRAVLTVAGREMLRNGRLETAVRLVQAADSLPGPDLRSYSTVRIGDSIFRTRNELAMLMTELADTLARRQQNPEASKKLLLKASKLINDDRRIGAQTARYRKALPQRLRSKTEK